MVQGGCLSGGGGSHLEIAAPVSTGAEIFCRDVARAFVCVFVTRGKFFSVFIGKNEVAT